MCFRFLQVTWSFFRTGELPHHDHGHVDGLEEEAPPVDANPYSLDDNLDDLKHRSASREGGKEMSAAIIFGLLLVLMLTGMPISISLGLTVLTFLFTMTRCRSSRWP
jgi:hypothetical protein